MWTLLSDLYTLTINATLFVAVGGLAWSIGQALEIITTMDKEDGHAREATR